MYQCRVTEFKMDLYSFKWTRTNHFTQNIVQEEKLVINSWTCQGPMDEYNAVQDGGSFRTPCFNELLGTGCLRLKPSLQGESKMP